MEDLNGDLIHEDLNFIIDYLKGEGYEADGWNFMSMETMLTSSCSSRNQLLFCILQSFGITYSVEEQRAFDKRVKSKIVHDMSALGICKPNNLEFVEATSSPQSQLSFWKTLIKMRMRLTIPSSSQMNLQVDQLLYPLVSSSHFEDSIKDERLLLVPESIKELLENREMQRLSLEERIMSLNEEIAQSTLSETSEPLSEEELQPPSELMKSIEALRNQNKALTTIYTDSFASWCKSSASVSPRSEIGDLVSNTYGELVKLEKSFSLTKSVIEENEELQLRMGRLKQDSCGTGSRVLESIVSEF